MYIFWHFTLNAHIFLFYGNAHILLEYMHLLAFHIKCAHFTPNKYY